MPPEPMMAVEVKAEPEMKSKGGMPCITLPGGYMPEDGKKPGDVVQALVSLKLGEKGDAYIESVDGAKYAQAETPEEDTVEPAEEPTETAAPPMSFRDKAMAM